MKPLYTVQNSINVNSVYKDIQDQPVSIKPKKSRNSFLIKNGQDKIPGKKKAKHTMKRIVFRFVGTLTKSVP